MTFVTLPDHDLLPKNGSAVLFMIVRRSDGGPTALPDDRSVPRRHAGDHDLSQISAKARLLLTDDRVCCVLPDPDRSGRGVALYGHAAVVPIGEFVGSSTTRRDGAMHVPDEVLATLHDRLESQKRIVFRINVADA